MLIDLVLSQPRGVCRTVVVQILLGRVSKAPVRVTRCPEAGVNRYCSGGCGGYGVAVAGDRVQRRLTETNARTRRSEWCQALYCEG
jgi:hypothetical protein